MITIVSIVSRQIWPQILSILHYKPNRVILLHTNAELESKFPAKRIKEFLRSNSVCVSVFTQIIDHSTYDQMLNQLESLIPDLSEDKNEVLVNLTGGTKLMAIAVVEWCRKHNLAWFYLERDQRIFPFQFIEGKLISRPSDRLDPALANHFAALDLLKCQLYEAEIRQPGSNLRLSSLGNKLDLETTVKKFSWQYPFHELMVTDSEWQTVPFGIWLEKATAFVLLKLGVESVQMGIRLQPRGLESKKYEEGELDLLFSWGGKLWLVDCKDKQNSTQRAEKLERIFKQCQVSSDETVEFIEKVKSDLTTAELAVLRQDLVQTSEIAGILGELICVRTKAILENVQSFSKNRGIRLIQFKNLVQDIKICLFPDRKPESSELANLAKHFNK